MDNRGKVEIGSPIWIEKQREIRQASADEYEFYERSGHNYPAALDEIERLAADNRKLREAHELVQSGYGTYTHTGNENAMQREAEKGGIVMEHNQVTPEWIDQQRQISEIVDMVCEDAPGSVVPLLKQIEKSQTAALDALEASMQREAEKDATIALLKNRLTNNNK